MPKERRGGRTYWRNGRAYGDFRDFSDVGGGQEALIPPGLKSATKDDVIAAALVSDRLEELQEFRRNRVLLGVREPADLAEYVEHHLIEKKKSGAVTDRWIAALQQKLDDAIAFFERQGPRNLDAISVADVQAWAERLRARESPKWDVPPSDGRPGVKATLSGGAIRHYLNALSHLYTRAQSEGRVRVGYNPVAAMLDKPTAASEETRWLEVDECALLLEAARLYRPRRKDAAARMLYPLLATLALTGGRPSEIEGLDVEDVSFDRRTITIRPNRWRRVKTKGSRRSVRMWPQLEEILRAYVFGERGPKSGPLFPGTRSPRKSERAEGPRPIGDYRKTLDQVAALAGWDAGAVRPRMLRHTYCAARLQTLDRGAPVSPYTVGRELGHGGPALVERVYGHLGEIRHRSEQVEFLIGQHADSDRIRPRLEAIRIHR